MEFRENFWGSKVVYTFNSYVLLDHSPQELANDPNPFAAVMEAAWQFLKKPKDEQSLARLKLDMIKRLLKRNLPKNQVKAIISFITLYVDFENSAIRNKFEKDLITITKADQPMGIEQAIQEELKRQGIEQGLAIGIEQGIEKGIEQGIEKGEAKRDEELLKNAVPELFQMGLDAQRIASILNLSIEDVQSVIDQLREE